jgi:hypothetical protein
MSTSVSAVAPIDPASERRVWSRVAAARCVVRFFQTFEASMDVHCPSCLQRMTKTDAPRVSFSCGPCRETILFFNVRAEADSVFRSAGAGAVRATSASA